jgi:5-methylcytosine-specific restriction endonuclease McrA
MKKKQSQGKNKNGIDLLDKKRTPIIYTSWKDVHKKYIKRREAVWNKTGGHCWYCSRYLSSNAFPHNRNSLRGFTVDHVQPRARGGSDELDNLVPCCYACNVEKDYMTLDEYRYYKKPQPCFYGERKALLPLELAVKAWLNGIKGAANIYMGIGMLRRAKFRKMIGVEEDE